MREGWTYKKLGEICSCITKGTTPTSLGFSFEEQGISFVKVESFTEEGSLLKDKVAFISEECNNALKRSQLEEDDILFSIAGAIGRVAIVPKDILPANTNQALAIVRLREKEKLTLLYLKYLLSSSYIKHQTNFYKAGVAQQNLSLGQLSSLQIPLPPKSQQEAIVSELDEINSLLALKREQLQKYDKLAQSLFYEMFGDPVENEKEWEVSTIDDIIDFEGGSQPDKSFFEYEKKDDNIRLIQIRDYKTDKYITYIPKDKARRFCSKDDIMIGRYGPPIFQILGGIEGAYNVALMKAVPKKGNKTFIRYYLKQDCLLHYLEHFARRVAGQDGIQMDKLKSYPFPYPPLSLQQQFASRIELIESQKQQVQAAIEKLETLLASRMQYWFE